MPTYLHPGVYVEEISGGVRPIEAGGTSTAAFVGIAEKGPLDEAVFIIVRINRHRGSWANDNHTPLMCQFCRQTESWT